MTFDPTEKSGGQRSYAYVMRAEEGEPGNESRAGVRWPSIACSDKEGLLNGSVIQQALLISEFCTSIRPSVDGLYRDGTVYTYHT